MFVLRQKIAILFLWRFAPGRARGLGRLLLEQALLARTPITLFKRDGLKAVSAFRARPNSVAKGIRAGDWQERNHKPLTKPY